MSLTQGLRRAAQVNPAAIALKEGPLQLTWTEVADRVARFAGALKQIGFDRGDRAAILSLNNHRYLEALFSIPWAGGVAVPINTRLAPAEISYILEDSGAVVLLLDSNCASLLPAIAAAKSLRAVIRLEPQMSSISGPSYESLIAESMPVEDESRDGDDLAGIYYTGGTTGRPKGVMLSHINLIANATNVSIALGYDRDVVYLHAPPMFHLADGCSTFAVTMLGGRHVFLPRFDPQAFLEVIQAECVTHVTLVPTMINMFINHPKFRDFDLSRLKRIYFGAAPMPDGLLRRAMSELPNVRFQQAWGMTELSPIATTMETGFCVLDGSNSGRLRSCGQAMPTVEVKIVDDADQEMLRKQIGEIVVRGPTVMRGYWNQPQATAEALRGGWMHSGDVGYMDEEGFVYIVDRLKDMIVTGGENVYSAEVENAISLMEEVSEVAVIGIPDDIWGEAVHAIVVPRRPGELTSEAIIASCKQRIASYKCPRSVEIRNSSLPLTAAGKILKTELRAPFWAGRGDRGVN